MEPNETSTSPPTPRDPGTGPLWGPDGGHPVAPAPVRSRSSRLAKVAVGMGAAFGVALGASALASAATTTTTTPSSSSSSSSTTPPSSGTAPAPGGPDGPRMVFGGGPGFGIGGPVLHGEFTVSSPSGGYETLEEQTGTVTSITNTSGSNWTLVVTSADNTALTYTIDTGTSVDGGESGVSSLTKGDTVHVLAVASNGTATAKEVTDSTVLKANGQSWMPQPPSSSSSSSSSSSTSS